MFGEGDDLWCYSVSNFIHTDGHTCNSTNISSSFCQFHSYFLWMGKPKNSSESATIEMCAAVRKYMLVIPRKWLSFENQTKQQSCCKAGNLSLYHKRTVEKNRKDTAQSNSFSPFHARNCSRSRLGSSCAGTNQMRSAAAASRDEGIHNKPEINK